MKICCLHSADEGMEAGAEDPEDVGRDPGLFTNQHTQITGIGSWEKLLQLCEQGGWYNQRICERIVEFLARYYQKVDHILSLSGFESMSVEELDFVLSRCFQLAKSSIKLGTRQAKQADSVKSFGEPRGWRLVSQKSTASSNGTSMVTFQFARQAHNE
ncbi:hypothetical protein ALT_7972 [Aspergillus lentulus]|uniref:Uncharacterized protein n=1 Tax=Aspergillus lentulus TaxID=293939 RepID=A0AAN4PQ71_ASPLE|nr:hypothetical protein ALT_7972 [Aspergillus lentulus]